MSTFIAKYRGTCGSCGAELRGSEAVYAADGSIVHAECQTDSDRPVGAICTTCRIEKPCFCD